MAPKFTTTERGCNIQDNSETDEVDFTSDDEPLLQPEISVVKPKPLWKRYIHEPLVFTFFYSLTLPLNCSSSLFFDRACVLNFNRTVEECKGNDTELFDRVQVIATNYSLASTLIRFLPAAFIGFFIGPWSDKYGKKPPVYVVLICYAFSNAGMLWYVSVEDAPLYYALITTIPAGLSGGVIACLACIYAMASESTSLESRTMKYACIELAMFLAMSLASLSAGFLYQNEGYMSVYLLALSVGSFPILLLFLADDDGEKQKANWKKKICDFFSCESARENLRTVMKHRERKGRLQLFLLFISTVIIIVNYIGLSEILYYYCEKMYRWSLLFYSEVNTYGSICSTVLILGSVPLMTKVFKVSDAFIGFIGILSLIGQQTARAFATEPWLYYVGTGLGLAGNMAALTMRAIISKIVEKNELAKIFAALAEVESLVPIVASLVATQIYNASIGFFPGLTFLVIGSFLLFPLVVFVWMARLTRVPDNTKDEATSASGASEIEYKPL